MEMYLLIFIILLLLIVIGFLVFRRPGSADPSKFAALQVALEKSLSQMEISFRDEFKENRLESADVARENRRELNERLSQVLMQIESNIKELNKTVAEKLDSIVLRTEESNRINREALNKSFKDAVHDQRNRFEDFRIHQKENFARLIDQLEKIQQKINEQLKEFSEQIKESDRQAKETMIDSFKGFRETHDRNTESFNNLQREKFSRMEERQNKLVETTEKRLEEVRATVDEKLQKTLNERLGQSFEIVGKQLESVQKGLGEMQVIASDVGGLKKVLSNVKLRGGIGEIQLAMLLEQILAPGQYEANVRTKTGSAELVEFAIKLPGKSEDEKGQVWLPVDAKFPKDAYEQLVAAYENGHPDEIEASIKNLELTIRKMAKDIRDKYISPPDTTDFAILFLPFESIYAEVIRRSALVDQLRDEYKVSIAGPTTLAAILNSLQMGFRTLALQKRSSEVWTVLGAVKTEFEKFGGLLEKAQKNLHTASDTVDELLGTRSKAITRKLKNVEALPAAEARQILPEIGMELEEGEE